MNFNHLKAFVKVVQIQSYQEAAKLLNVSQPAITLRIKALEERFQTKLMNRSHEGIQLTPQGEILYHESIEILKKWEQLERYYLSDRPTGNLALGASTIPSEYILPDLLKKFRANFPEVRFSMRVSGTKEVFQWLRNRNVDVIVTGETDLDKQIESHPMFDDELKIIAPTCEDYIINEFSDLLDYDWIFREEHSNTRQAFESMLIDRGYKVEQLRLAAQMGSTEAVIAAVESGLGISVISEVAAKRAQKYNRVQIVNLEDFNVSRKFYVSYLKENKNVPIVSAFLAFLDEFTLC